MKRFCFAKFFSASLREKIFGSRRRAENAENQSIFALSYKNISLNLDEFFSKHLYQKRNFS
jgi:hypothetical protein